MGEQSEKQGEVRILPICPTCEELPDGYLGCGQVSHHLAGRELGEGRRA